MRNTCCISQVRGCCRQLKKMSYVDFGEFQDCRQIANKDIEDIEKVKINVLLHIQIQLILFRKV